MKNLKLSLHTSLIASLVLCLGAGSLHAQQPLLPAGSHDLRVDQLVTVPTEKGLMPEISRDAVTYTYAVAALDANPYGLAAEPFRASSREYFVDVDAADLARGASIFTTAPGALVRIQPAASEQVAGRASSMLIDANALVVSSVDGEARSFAGGTGIDRLATADQLRAAGAPFVEGTLAFRLAADVGAGEIRLTVPTLERGSYTLHVFDKNSPAALELAADRVDYVSGDTLTVEASFAGARVSVDTVEGFVSSPAGRAWPLSISQRGNAFIGTLPLDAGAAPGQGLWEAHLVARGQMDGKTVVRTARTAFAAHLPTARLGQAQIERSRAGLAIHFDVEVATPGRYDVRGVLYGTDKQGSLRSVAIGHAADWLDASGSLSLEFDAKLLKDAGVQAPYEVRDLRLMDQGRMGLLHRQERALTIDR